MYKTIAAASLLLAAPALAAPVDLSSWQADNYGGANWTVQNAPANDSVFQSVNGNPTIFFEAGSLAQGTTLSGEITVETSADDDFIGFVLGYSDDEINAANADFILVDWKQGTQNFGGSTGNAGLAASRISGDLTSVDLIDTYWGHDAGSNAFEIQRGTNLGATGWNDNQTYTFDIVFTNSLIEVMVDGVLELSFTAADAGLASFDDGAFGFYNYSQQSVRYAGIEEGVAPDPDPQPVPAPGALGLLGLGVLALAARRRRS
ncbi:PEP-CTERM sorting domain-containing protein [Pacificimonas sp. WHA3]|uniref:PEP-CTERM sorting domain-containing protein n=1 Tax=Pacificimonas pallii TaxID=2827236 RepID=A0ABS6SC54_9SPHN|nr:PEP-CTERM sorting domain-containing protein [Pacificimonas pallii]MBV7256003.1 PEP-CTERM sorting domain-containing protein [Pacificimonas pallii]